MDDIAKTAIRAAEWWAERLMRGDVDVFKADLAKRVDEALRKQPTRIVYLENDYDPGGLLLDAVRATVEPDCRGFMFSGNGLFPQKHSTAIKVGLITPKEGYGNWTEEITI